MFYITSLTKTLNLSPQNLGVDIKVLISEKIREVEGKVVGNHGYIVSILEFNKTGKGIVNESGDVSFRIDYTAITFKPIKNEVLDAIPVFINEYGFFSKVGPSQVFSRLHSNEDGWTYNAEDNIWSSGNNSVEIAKPVRLKILENRIESNEITALGELYV